MPDRSRKRPRDLNSLAASIVGDATDETPELEPNDGKDPGAVSLGRRGGLKGGKARAAKLTPQERRATARKASQLVGLGLRSGSTSGARGVSHRLVRRGAADSAPRGAGPAKPQAAVARGTSQPRRGGRRRRRRGTGAAASAAPAGRAAASGGLTRLIRAVADRGRLYLWARGAPGQEVLPALRRLVDVKRRAILRRIRR